MRSKPAKPANYNTAITQVPSGAAKLPEVRRQRNRDLNKNRPE